MELDEALTHVAVLGAAGKMGSGIALLLLQEVSRLALEKKAGDYKLKLIDVKEDSFPALRTYLEDQLFKFAEKNINSLRNYFAQNQELISNEEIINAYVSKAINLVYFETNIDAAKNAHLVFEAVLEDIELKTQIFRTLVERGNKNGFFLSNTSSIPIHVLNEKGNLNNRIMGYHFYNPPAVQKLLEVIPLPNTSPDLAKIAFELAKRLKKTVVQSKDVAGFIGNGYLIREVAFACEKVEELSKEHSLLEAIYMVNRVTQDWLIRPMGIFQLMDYVGLDVCQQISHIMHIYLKDPSLEINLIHQMTEKGILGGQNSDGTQKNGFFSYAKHTLQGIYSLPKERYDPFTEATWIMTADRTLGDMPKGHLSWKTFQKEFRKTNASLSQGKALKTYFENLFSQKTLGAELAKAFLQKSFTIANKLVEDGVARSLEEIDTVLIDGFYHVYPTMRKN